MLWDKKTLEPIKLVSDKRGLAVALTLCSELTAKLRRAMNLAGFDVIRVDDADRCIATILSDKPDIVFLDERPVKDPAALRVMIARARVTETLPLLSIGEDSPEEKQSLALAVESQEIEIFLKTRALLRCERPFALRGKRQSGRLILDEPSFKLHLEEKSANLSKTELCLLGPFFDVNDAVFDRQSLETLVFAGNNWKLGSRSTEFHVIRMRRRVKARLGVDPLRSVRGIGYALADI